MGPLVQYQVKYVKMKFSVYQKHVAIVALYECGQTAKEITNMFKKLSINA